MSNGPKILFIGDIVGRSGRDALEIHLPALKREHEPDIIIVNGENAANGIGITSKISDSFFDMGVDVITTGNHVWGQRETLTKIGSEPRLLRPLNFPEGTPGKGAYVFTSKSGHKILIINALGLVFMESLSDPFKAIHDLVTQQGHILGRDMDAIFVDFHAEATSEKNAIGHYLDGKVSAVIGTHTHIPTADARILPKGTAFQTDTGMTGDYDSVIGVKKDQPIHRFVKKYPTARFEPASGDATLCGCIIECDEEGLATSINTIKCGGIL